MRRRTIPILTASIQQLFFNILFILLLANSVIAQSTIEGYTPEGLKTGRPAGSFQLSDFDNINYFNGNLNFSLPLISSGGRGDISYTIPLRIESKWQIYQSGGPGSGVRRPHFSNWEQFDPGYSPGVVIERHAKNGSVYDCIPSDQTYDSYNTLTRLTFITPDGSETELRDVALNGVMGDTYFNSCQLESTPNRGKMFKSSDGSGLTFISDLDVMDHGSGQVGATGYLLMLNGSRYRVEGGRIKWIRDRNGNKLTFTYATSGNEFGRVTSITDSLNRQITFSYAYIQAGAITVRDYDLIVYKGFSGVAKNLTIKYKPLSQSLRNGVVQTHKQLFPEMNWATNEIHDPTLPNSVQLPDGRSYQFKYNIYGELARVELPTRGSIEYDHAAALNGSYESGSYGVNVYRRIIERRVYVEKESTVITYKTTISRPESYVNAATTPTTVGYVDVETKGASDNLFSKDRHYYYESSFSGVGGSVGYGRWKTGREWKTEKYANDGITVIQRLEQTWQQPLGDSKWPITQAEISDNVRPNNSQITQTTSTLVDSNQVTRQTFAYDEFFNRADVYDYGYGYGSPGPLVRRTQTQYLRGNPYQGNIDYAADPNVHIRNLPIYSSISDGNGIEISKTWFDYDIYGNYGLPVLQDCPGISQHDGSFHTGYVTRGNLVKVTQLATNAPSYTNQHNFYDIAGNVIKKLDQRNVATTFDYSDRFGYSDGEARGNGGGAELGGQISYAFPTKVINALGHEAYTQYDYYLGKPVNVEDANGIVSSTSYNDPLDRPTQGIRAVNDSANKSQTSITYDDTNRIITTTSDLIAYGDNKLKSEVLYDGLGRTFESRTYENATSYIISKTEYDALGRPSKVSNPYRPGEAVNWTSSFYDSLGRVINVATQDGAHVTTQYYGNQVTVTDQAGKTRRSETDVLGRLIKVTENPGGLNYETNYSYDVLGNLRQVVQGAQTRTYVYDSLSRLISATNPESGTITYSYDANGNLIQKIDARGVRIGMEYDVLNRVKSKIYFDTASNITPPVYYYYDNYSSLPPGAPALSGGATIGKLLGVRYGGGSDGTYYKYDQLGRIITNHQRTGTANNATTYEYNLAGNITVETRGSSRKIIPAYDEIGRLTSLNTSTSPYISNQNLLSSVSYTSFGAIQLETYGNNLTHKIGYNERLQPIEIKLGSEGASESLLKLGYIYGTANNPNDGQLNTLQNNGNVGRINYSINGALQNSQTYQYDQLNRLQYSVENKNGLLNDANRAWYQSFSYDRYGNKQLMVTPAVGEQWVDQVWFDDSLPQGAATGANGGDWWNWISSGPSPKSGSISHTSNNVDWVNWSPSPYSGNVSHQSNIASGIHQHYFWYDYANTSGQIRIEGQGKLYAYVYLDPLNVPEEIMLQWRDQDGSWEHRAYWGANNIGWGADGTTARKYMGALPQAGGWVRLEVPLLDVGFERLDENAPGISGMAFTLYGGRANWDLAGVETSTRFRYKCRPQPDPEDPADCYWEEYSAYENKIIADDSYVAGSSTGSDGGDGWNWRGGDNVEMFHQHYFYNASQTLNVNAGDKLNAWVYLDPSNVPEEVMLQWYDNESWKRAYWGANKISGPKTYMGPLPQVGQWVKLEVPASTVGLEGKTVNGMAFTLWGGQATWDLAGKIAYIPPTPLTYDLSYNQSNNRITTSGYFYDASGNLIAEPGKSYTYDGENRIVSANGGAISQYSYDGNGRRIKKKVGQLETRFEYGASGELIAEYDHSTGSLIKEYFYKGGELLATKEPSGGFNYATSDHLGTPRVWTDQNGNVVSRHDYKPFGEELFAGTGTRTTAQGYAINTQQDGQRKQFTSKERDVETGLDFFEARYYSSTQGRFVSVDPFDPILGRQGASPEDAEQAEREFRSYLRQPQHWNRYVYALNNPLKYIDPDGMQSITVNLNIIWDAASNFSEEQKKKIRETYIAQAKKDFGKIDVQFNITETIGGANNLGVTSGDKTMVVAAGMKEGAINAFFTKSDIATGAAEATNYANQTIFLSTRNGDKSELSHGIIHAAGIAGGINGYQGPKILLGNKWLGALTDFRSNSAENATVRILNFLESGPKHFCGYGCAKAGTPIQVTHPKPPKDLPVMKNGLQRFINK